MKTLFTTLLLSFLAATASHADIPGVGVGPWEASLVDLGGPEAGIPDTWASLWVRPDGSGPGFDGAYVFLGAGATVDATIHVTVIHPYSGAMAGYPAEDMWLEGVDGGIVGCGGHVIADGPSDADGRTTFSLAPAAGGGDAGGLLLMFSGVAWIGPVLPVRVNSPDINGDGRVDLSDGGFFATDLFGGFYHYRSDYNADGVINLSDMGVIATSVGRNCPE